mmetsp:Transcript_87419/g.271618  ORF Transcript_87419/g.271618 Transcript_87419/m.271618 type:complete len:564 (-) Transcript_87419:49-1740(-)
MAADDCLGPDVGALHDDGRAGDHGEVPIWSRRRPQPERGGRLRRRAHDRRPRLHSHGPDGRRGDLPPAGQLRAVAHGRGHAPDGDPQLLLLRGGLFLLRCAIGALHPEVVSGRPLLGQRHQLPRGRPRLLQILAVRAVPRGGLLRVGCRVHVARHGDRCRPGPQHRHLPLGQRQDVARRQHGRGQQHDEPHEEAALGAARLAQGGRACGRPLPSGAALLRFRPGLSHQDIPGGRNPRQSGDRAVLHPQLCQGARHGRLGRAAAEGRGAEGVAPRLQGSLLPHDPDSFQHPPGREDHRVPGQGPARGPGPGRRGRERRRLGRGRLTGPALGPRHPEAEEGHVLPAVGPRGPRRFRPRDGRPGLLRGQAAEGVLLRQAGLGPGGLHALLPHVLHVRRALGRRRLREDGPPPAGHPGARAALLRGPPGPQARCRAPGRGGRALLHPPGLDHLRGRLARSPPDAIRLRRPHRGRIRPSRGRHGQGLPRPRGQAHAQALPPRERRGVLRLLHAARRPRGRPRRLCADDRWQQVLDHHRGLGVAPPGLGAAAGRFAQGAAGNGGLPAGV